MEILRRAWDTWKRIAQFLGDWIGRLVLTVFYFTLFAPFGLGVRLLSDPLSTKQEDGAQWLERPAPDLNVDNARRLF